MRVEQGCADGPLSLRPLRTAGMLPLILSSPPRYAQTMGWQFCVPSASDSGLKDAS